MAPKYEKLLNYNWNIEASLYSFIHFIQYVIEHIYYVGAVLGFCNHNGDKKKKIMVADNELHSLLGGHLSHIHLPSTPTYFSNRDFIKLLSSLQTHNFANTQLLSLSACRRQLG